MKESGVLTGSLGKRFESGMSEEIHVYRESEYTLKICRDGFILFNHANFLWDQAFTKGIKAEDDLWGRAYRYLNCINLLFHSALLKAEIPGLFSHSYEFTEICNRDVTLFFYEGGKCCTIPNRAKSHFEKYRRRSIVSNYDTWCLFDLLFLMHTPVLPHNVFDILNNDLLKLSGSESSVADVSILAQSLSQYKMANFEMSVILAWTLIERYLGELWEWFVESSNISYPDGKKRIDKYRRDALNSHRDYPASIQSNMLEFLNVIPFEKFDRINRLRKCRNEFIHYRKPCTIEDAGLGITTAVEIIREERGLDLRLDMGVLTIT